MEWILVILLLLGMVLLHQWWSGRYDEATARIVRMEREQLAAGAPSTAQNGDLTQSVREIFDNMAEGVLVLDPAGCIEFTNRSFRNLFGMASDPTGKTVMEALRLHQVNKLAEQLKTQPQVAQWEITLPGLENRYLEVNGVAVAPSIGQNRGAILVFHDLTRIKRLENVRQEFVANVSHELRTPLSIIKGCVETLLYSEEDCSDLQKRFLGKIENHSNRLAFLIEDLLALSQLEAGNVTLDLREMNLHQLATGIFDSLSGMAGKKNVSLVNEIAADATIQADNQRLVQALNNLVENGIKYGREGGSVWVSANEIDAEIELCVVDDGPGIPASDRERIFERFYRVDKGRSRELGGTGLGLSIVKHVVQLHGGTARVECPPEGGTRFLLSLPREQPSFAKTAELEKTNTSG